MSKYSPILCAVLITVVAAVVARLGCVEARHERPTISRTFAYENALPLSLVESVRHDAEVLNSKEGKYALLKNNKRLTRWLPRGQRPRNVLEEAVLWLEKIVRPGRDGTPYVGAEYWVQRVKGVGGDIGFHLDKDESVASNKHYLLHPEFSSILYLTNTGGCTLILDQHSPDGNGYDPVKADEGELVCPQANKYAIFNGTLLHGVMPGPSYPGADEPYRITFLVNWWPVKPEEPNCVPLDTKSMPELQYLSKKKLKRLRAKLEQEVFELPKSQKRRRVPFTTAVMDPASPRKTKSFDFSFGLPGGSTDTVAIPEDYNVHGSYKLIWNDDKWKSAQLGKTEL
jgi:hypothetical protein